MTKPYIVYTLSKDRTTQKFSKSKFQDIVKDIETFLQNYTTTNFNQPTTIELTAYTAYDETDPSDVLTEIINKTTEQFGSSDNKPIAYHYPTGAPHSTSKFIWKLSKDKLHHAIQYIVDSSPMPKSSFGPLELFISYSFKLVDKDRKELLNQEHTSIFCIWLSRSKSCSPTLFFPFEAADQKFWDYIDNLKQWLPFKLEEKYLRIAHVSKLGEVTSFKKIERQ